jgi:anti-anti-sigma regulatory factor
MTEMKSIGWDKAVERLAEILKSRDSKLAVFLGSSLTDQEIGAVKALCDACRHEDVRENVVVAKGFDFADTAGVDALLASFETNTPKGKVKPDVAGLVQKTTLLAKATEFGGDLSVFPDNLRTLYSLGANVRGLLSSNLVTHTPEAAADAIKAGEVSTLLFIDCTPGDFGLVEGTLLAEGFLKNVKKILFASNDCNESSFDLRLPVTAWAEREGTYTGAFSGAKLEVHMGPLPPEGARSLRWIFAEALRKLSKEIPAAEMAL